MSEAPALSTVQRWMQAILVHSQSVEEGLEAEAATREIPAGKIGDVVVPTEALTALERVAIYQEMYLLRMTEALAADYPVLSRTLGEDDFAALVSDYVSAHPSTSYTLNRLGDHLPRFAAGWGPRERRRLLGEIASLELALTESFDAPEEDRSLVAVDGPTPEAAATLVLVPSSSLRVVRVRRLALDAFDALRDGRPIPPPARGVAAVAFYRRDDEVRRLVLSSAAARLLSGLAAGRTLGDAVSTLPLGLAADAVSRWLLDWVSEGLFARVDA